MIYLKKRQIKIIEALLYQNRKLTLKQLSEQFNVSIRTIRKDLEAIEEWLKKRGIQLMRDPAEGVWVLYEKTVNLGDFNQKDESSFNTILNPRDRQALMILHLLNAEKPLTIRELSEKLLISYSTAVKDLKDIDDILTDLGLSLIRKQNYGLRIEGEERSIRKAITKIIMKHVNNQYLFQLISENGNKILPSNEFIDVCIDVNTLKELRKIIVSVAEMFNCQFSDYDYIITTIDLSIAIKRIKNHHEIAFDKHQKIGLSDRIQYLMAKKLAGIIGEYYKIRFSEDEILELTIKLLGIHYISGQGPVEPNKYSINSYLNVDIIGIVKNLFKKFEVFYGIDLSKNIDLLFSLADHLKTTLYRLENKLLVYNPLMEEIKTKYPYMFQFCSFISEEISKELTIEVLPEEEIAYLTMYFQIALENFSKHQVKAPKVLVICGNSNAIINYLKIRLQKVFPELDVVGPISQNHLNFSLFKENSFDFIISTVPFQHHEYEICLISPLLTREDINAVHEKMTSLAIRKTENIKGGEQLMLKDVLKKETIKTGVEVEDWEQAIRRAGELLLNIEGIKPSYIDKMVESVKKLGPYIVIAPGIALAHARPEDGVNFPCFSLITLKNPVNFGNPENDPVKLIIAIASVDHDTHLRALSELVEVIGDEEKYKTIINAKEEQEILNLLINQLH